jgi:spore maturation protein CgeB
MPENLNIVMLGLSVTSSWGNGHATTFRHLMKALHERGHEVLFLERDMPWYAAHRDLPAPPYGRTELYASIEELQDRFGGAVREADLVIVGSYVPQGVAVGRWATSAAGGVTAFYDIDTPVTLRKLSQGDEEYLSRDLIPKYRLYLSFTGGPTLAMLRDRYGSPCPRPLYCSVDPDHYHPASAAPHWDLGYLGTYSDDRQPTLDRLLLEPARRFAQGLFVVAGPMYPETISWPANVERREHVPPDEHPAFYGSQRFTLNVTRADMVAAGFSPSIRLFEAAACGAPVISDAWEGLGTFFTLGEEILISVSPEQTLRYLTEIPEEERRRIGARARQRVLEQHTSAHRAAELEKYVSEAVAVSC